MGDVLCGVKRQSCWQLFGTLTEDRDLVSRVAIYHFAQIVRSVLMWLILCWAANKAVAAEFCGSFH